MSGMHHNHSVNYRVEYIKLIVVLAFITFSSWLLSMWHGLTLMTYLESFMGIFFIVFALFKYMNLDEFAHGIRDYVGLENIDLKVAKQYPAVQTGLGILYVLGVTSIVLDVVVLLWSSYSALVVYRTIKQKKKVHCMCLGNVIKLPLSTTSFVEDFGMAAMAAVMIVLRVV